MDTARITIVEQFVTSCIIIILYAMTARSLRNLGSGKTAQQERTLLKFGIVNSVITIPAIFFQVSCLETYNSTLIFSGVVIIPNISNPVDDCDLLSLWSANRRQMFVLLPVTVAKSAFAVFSAAVTLVVVNKTFRQHLLESFGLARYSQFPLRRLDIFLLQIAI